MTGLHLAFLVTSSLLHPAPHDRSTPCFFSHIFTPSPPHILTPSFTYFIAPSSPRSFTPSRPHILTPSPLHPHPSTLTPSQVPVLVFTAVAIACSITTTKDVRATYCKRSATGRKDELGQVSDYLTPSIRSSLPHSFTQFTPSHPPSLTPAQECNEAIPQTSSSGPIHPPHPPGTGAKVPTFNG